jgi:anti-sigma B factor antagonist
MALIRSEVKGDVRIIFFDEPRLVDPLAIDQCYREIIEELGKIQERNVLLHFGRVAFLSSSALGILIRINKKCKDFKTSLKLCNIAPDIFQVFKITGLDKMFDIRADAADALEAFKSAGKSFFRKHGETTYEVK